MKVDFKKFVVKFDKVSKPEREEKFWPVFMVSLALFLMVSFGSDFIDFARAATSSVALSVTVSSTLSFSVDSGSKGFAALTAGTPQQATSMLYVTTNNATGYYTSINRASTTVTLSSGSETISDAPSGYNWTAPTATSTATGPSATWTYGTTKGLGFRVVVSASDIGSGASTTCGAATGWWGATDDGAAKFSGVSTSTSAQKIADCNFYNSGGTGQAVVFRLDVPVNQAGGTYTSSPITYTVLAN
ncbi:hypothetical protein A2833_02335 [Candidatus Azambacteria bacterium RIFCSPHIGHO2_01_FULL_44_55]|uniref:Uncharacterized protein n=1 Tax=Candidatus Azambacteria bacterium RIFCSPLOWO2_02_FULL_44_14 TaxID=1797306 RepID=A0A1F5CA67_9BACT|nr:MAG: hypothetical protein A3A18_02920 [Candidatus Azambacteria bacterium RIFCSPLOWO2_01_FULL_44_84]OGD33583.1 MAG: hypothetical protein A3C78_02295 [Candidatus Azambacteria bacterium RIFCSPHIGHO2_02_FULL_45_18]OGD39735.1 MAG: hypothetical protein A3I30_00695 [Candidatus Azambacteria bacterium RIFCSPLOWO2_02_FULL_44_14]OGD40098.1 MAG: hypothetical protein A2833_02335 [Candidatus Azambacteria bacterium RIFCSPHIGHO2_01_FULL_44_55]OGD49854.1 MAG: hypothetical protein A2608_03100 [Candidatus Azam